MRPSSGRDWSFATATRTSAWNSAWFSQIRLITEALVTWMPVRTWTRSRTRLKVMLVDPV